MISFNNFQRQYAQIRTEVDAAMQRVFDRGYFILGPECQSFEEEFARYLGVGYCVGVASGTDAITLALLALGIGDGDEVITTNMTAFPTITGIFEAGATPVVVDIFGSDGLMDFTKIKEKITSKTKAIIPVHLYGQSVDMQPILDLAKTYGISVVEDCAQAAGASYGEHKVGSLGHCGAFSFYPTKNLGAYGDGGMISTNDEKVYQRLCMLRNYGQKNRYYHSTRGKNSRLDEIQAAVLRAKLPHLDVWNARRRTIADRYQAELTTVECLVHHAYGDHVYHLFVVQHEYRDELQIFLQNHEIQTLIHYPVPVQKQEFFTWQKEEWFPQTEQFTSRILSLPLYPELTDDEVTVIIDSVNSFVHL